jgi:D-3-phosphoglycerate dehydrogenase
VAEHTLMLMLAAARRTVAHHIASTTGNWNERNRFDSTELDGKTFLVLGFGRIGRRVAELAKAFGMSVRAFDPYVSAEHMTAAGVAHVPSLTSDLATVDFVSVHMPGGQHGAIITAAELAMMKPTAIIVNAARGGVIDEAALDTALRQRKLRAAAVDVLTTEPPSADHPLLSNPYVTISPHNAGLTEECAMRMSLSAAQNILDALDGKLNPKLVVNADKL